MIRRVDQISNLAIVGLSVALPGGGGIDEFGRLVYRGMPISGQFGGTLTIESAAPKAIREMCAEARQDTGRLAVINLSPMLSRTLRENGIGSHIQEVPEVIPALEAASEWLECSGEDTVLLVEARYEPQIFCAVLIMEQKSARDNSRPIFARIAGAAEADAPLSAAAVSGVMNEVRRSSGVPLEAIELIETATLNIGEICAEEAEGLLGSEGSDKPTSCALGSSLAGLPGLVKTVWCLSGQVIPCTPGWDGPDNVETWQDSPFYLATESRAWFISSSRGHRYAGLNLLATDGRVSHILMSDTHEHLPKRKSATNLEALHLFPIAIHSSGEVPGVLAALLSKITTGSCMADVAQETYQQYLREKSNSQFVASVLGSTPEELIREIGFAAKGIPTAFEKMSDWQTPLGSFFTPKPLGKEGKVCFVYPGAFNSYPGIGRDLFYLFPALYDQLSEISDDIGSLLNEQRLYPRSISALTSDDLTAIEAQLNADPITMLISGSCLAFLYTEVLRNIFDIHPASAFGYSLGEVSMLFASRVWTDADGTSKALRSLPFSGHGLPGLKTPCANTGIFPTGAKAIRMRHCG